MGKDHKRRSRSRSSERKDRKKKSKKRDSSPKHRSYSRSYSRSSSRSSSSYSKHQKRKHSPSRSRSKDRRKNKHRSVSRSKSNSRSRSYDRRSPKRDSSKDRKGGGRFKDIPENIRNPRKREPDAQAPQRKRYAVNSFALAGFILDTKKTNERLDKEEVKEANTKFKKIDKSERTAKLMSAHLNSKEDQNKDDYVMEFVNGEYVKVMKPFLCGVQGCGMRFRFTADLEEHLKMHQKEEAASNRKRAEDFLNSL